ncbi:MAG: hypothetical protein WED09_13750 [Homoserinimonas sp.]
MRRQIENYRPYSVSATDWDACAGFVRNAVAAARPKTIEQAAQLLRLATRLTLWSVKSSGLSMAYGSVFHPENIRRHIAGTEIGTASTRRRDTARLGVLSNSLLGTPLPRSTNRGSPQVAKPYSARDRAGLNSWAARQRQEWKRRDGQFILALGFGAGLEANEIRNVRRNDIQLNGTVMTITLMTGNPRTVPVLRAEAQTIMNLIDKFVVDDYLLSQHSRGNTDLMAGFHSTNNYGAPNPRRLRSTWIVTHLSCRPPLPEFLAAAGLSSTATLLRYLPFVTATEHAAEILAGAGT